MWLVRAGSCSNVANQSEILHNITTVTAAVGRHFLFNQKNPKREEKKHMIDPGCVDLQTYPLDMPPPANI